MARPRLHKIFAALNVVLFMVVFSASALAHDDAAAPDTAGRAHCASYPGHAASQSLAGMETERVPRPVPARTSGHCADGYGHCSGTGHFANAVSVYLISDSRRTVFVPAASGPPPGSAAVRVLLPPPMIL